jgi:hypothetical protein
MSRKIINKAPAELRPHPLNKELYGPPTKNEQYENIRFAMERAGFDERHPLLVTDDGRIISGVTRWAVASRLKLAAVPCEVFVPENAAAAELEIEAKLITENGYRRKTRLMVAREQQKLLEIQKVLGRARMAKGSDGGASKSEDRVGAAFKVSGKTVQRNLKVLAAIDRATEDGDRRKADRLTELLETGKTGKALDQIAGKAGKPKKPAKVEVPPTLHAHDSKAYGEFYEACAKVQVAAEIQLLEASLERMRQALEAARAKLERQTDR